MTDDRPFIERIVQRCGPAVLVAPEDAAQRRLNMRGETFAAVPLLRPASTDEVVFIVQTAREAGRALVPVGGATGLVDALKTTGDGQWYLSLERMKRIERVDPVSRVAHEHIPRLQVTVHAPTAMQCAQTTR